MHDGDAEDDQERKMEACRETFADYLGTYPSLGVLLSSPRPMSRASILAKFLYIQRLASTGASIPCDSSIT